MHSPRPSTRPLQAPLLAAALMFFSMPASAQDGDAAEHSRRIREVSASVEAEASCIRTLADRVAMTRQLLQEAEAQRERGTSTADTALTAAANQTIEALWLRLREAVSGIADCRRDHLGGERITFDRDGNPVLHVEAEADPGADSLGEDGNTLQLIDAGSRLSGQVWVIRGHQVDGAARPQTAPLQQAIHDRGQAMEACYRELQGRQHAGELRVELSFEVHSNGRVRRTELSPGMNIDRRFSRCLVRTISSIRPTTRFSGPPITLAYQLRFSSEP